MSWQEIADDNVIFPGPPTGIRQMEDLPADPLLVLDASGIHNLFPKNGETPAISDQPARNGAEAGTSFALITRAPAMNGPGAILMLSGNETASVMGAVQAFTNPTVAAALVSRLRAASGIMPKYFQAVLRIKAMDDVPVSIEYVLHRELPASDQHSERKQ